MARHHIISFASLLGDIGEGLTDTEITREYNTMVGKLQAHAGTHGSAKGTIGLTLEIAIDRHGKAAIEVQVPKVTLPKEKLAGSTYFLDVDENGETVLSKRNPKQRDLFEDAVEYQPRPVQDAQTTARNVVSIDNKKEIAR